MNIQNPLSNITPKENRSAILASWSTFFGSFGLICNFILPMNIYDLPGGLVMGIIGIACAILSKFGAPLSKKARLGLTLSIVSAVSGLFMAFVVIFAMNVMETDSQFGQVLKQVMLQMQASASNALKNIN